MTDGTLSLISMSLFVLSQGREFLDYRPSSLSINLFINIISPKHNIIISVDIPLIIGTPTPKALSKQDKWNSNLGWPLMVFRRGRQTLMYTRRTKKHKFSVVVKLVVNNCRWFTFQMLPVLILGRKLFEGQVISPWLIKIKNTLDCFRESISIF